MKPKLLLRIAAALMLLHTIGHSIGALSWKKAPNAQIGNVIGAMQNQHFEFMGRQVSFGGFYEGYVISMIFVLLLITVLLTLVSNNPQYPMVAALSVFLILLAITEYIYFFPFAAAFSLLAGLCAGFTLFKKPI
ncbi:LIC_13387 family protein [Flavitalea flava]